MASEKLSRIALVGTDTLRGKEIKEVFENKPLPAAEIDFLDHDVEELYGKLTEFRGEARVIQPLTPAAIELEDLSLIHI